MQLNSLFESIGSNRVNESEVAYYCVLFATPFPMVWSLALWLISLSAASSALNQEYVQIYYLLSPFLCGIYILLAVVGKQLMNTGNNNPLYVHLVIQSLTIITFTMCAFFGFFTTPVSLAIIAAIGIGSVVFDRAKIWAGLATISALCAGCAYWHANGLPPVPIANSMMDLQGALLTWASILFLLSSAFFIAVFAFFTTYLMENAQKKKLLLESLSIKLARYLSPQIYSSIFSGQKDVKIETYRKKLTVFFSDIKSFTEITDGMESEALSTLLNNYLNEMSIIALKHGGTIDKFIGDAILIFFGDPESRGYKEDALACVAMATEMRERMKELQSVWYRQGISDPLEIRIGINTGYCTVGNFGSIDRMDYTAVGSQVNLAAALESRAEPNSILLSADTWEYVKEDYPCEQVASFEQKGDQIKCFQVLSLDEETDHKLAQSVNEFMSDINFKSLDEADRFFILNNLQRRL